MKNLPKLFARNSDGTVQEWEIIVSGNKYATIHGKQNCEKVTSEWTVTEGKNLGKKNATTPEEQAISEAESRWEKKVKHGGYWENIKDIDKTKFVEPMLANHYKDRPANKVFHNGPVMVDRKYNGKRQVTHKDGGFSRKGEPVPSAPHIFERVKHLFQKHPNLVLDGELYNHEYRYKLSEFIKFVNKTKHITPEDLAGSARVVDYYVYDGYGFVLPNDIVVKNGLGIKTRILAGTEITEEIKCSVRRQALRELLANIEDVVVVETRWAGNEKEVMEIYFSDIADGYEGSMVRIDTEYQHKRTNDLLKVKPEDDDEGKVIAINEGTGNWSGVAKTATIEWHGHTFDATFKGSYEELAEVLKNAKDWIEKIVTFLHIGYTGKAVPGAPNGLPFSPRIDINNCFKGENE